MNILLLNKTHVRNRFDIRMNKRRTEESMFPKFLHEVRGSLTLGRDLGKTPLANEEIATKQGKVLGQSAFAVLSPEHHQLKNPIRYTQGRTILLWTEDMCQPKGPRKSPRVSDPGEFKLARIQSRKMAG
jgi:hypothetical protein